MPSSRGSSQPRDQTQISCRAGRFFTSWATREAHFGDYINSQNSFSFFKIKVCYLLIFVCAGSTPLRGLFSGCSGWGLPRAGSSGCWAPSPGRRGLVVHVGSAAAAHRTSCSMVCGIFPDQGLNPCLLGHQGSLIYFLFYPHHEVCRISVPQPRIETAPPGSAVLAPGPPGKSPSSFLKVAAECATV